MSKTFDDGKDDVAKLCRYFKTNRLEFLAPSVKEAEICQTLIQPFFEALGWDVGNAARVAPQYREVIPQPALDVDGSARAPDFAFRVGSQTRFYAEAKKCGVNIGTDPAPAYQLRRYGWSAKLPLSILTDFEELAVYDCTTRPREKDKASHARIQYYEYVEYPDRWRELWDVFSREAVWSGAFDQYAASKRKRGTSEVDAEFLKEIENWREVLAKNIALRNKEISSEDLNAAVQMTIDRVVFLRMAEDRSLEQQEQLLKLCEQPDVYHRFMRNLCRKADEKYNSGLFHFHKDDGVSEAPDRITPTLAIDDKCFKPILESLYFVHGSPYDFGVMPVEILGTVYERFLGNVIRLTPGHKAKIEEKPEVRKAGGVYYTPAYIVRYIVKQTVGQQIDGKSPAQLAGGKDKPRFRVLDMACGSGSFLLGAYQCLLDHCLAWYIDHNPASFTKAVYKDPPSGHWRLTIEEKKRILTAHIYGVDIDHQAVEVSKLSLLLKALEGENDATLSLQFTLFEKHRALPNLANNIKCGNSLIEPDYFASKLLIDPDEMRRANPFNWKAAFPDAMREGGFDCIIGNPPYLRIQGLQEYFGEQIAYLSQCYKSAVKRFDLYLLFTEKGYGLLKPGGTLGFICPHKFLNSDFGSGLRGFLAAARAVESFVSFGNNLVFSGSSAYTGILKLSKADNSQFGFVQIPTVSNAELPIRLSSITPSDFSHYRITELNDGPWALTSSANQALLDKLRQQPATIETTFAGVFQGVVTGIDELYFLKPLSQAGDFVEAEVPRDGRTIRIESAALKPMLKGEDVTRYADPRATIYCIYPYKLVGKKTVILEDAEFAKCFPCAYSFLSEFKGELRALRIKYKTNPRYWYSCHRARSMASFAATRIISQEISLGCNMTLDSKGLFHNTKVYSLLPSANVSEDILFWLAILNSKVLWWFLRTTGYALRGGYFTFKTEYLNPFPLPRIDFAVASQKAVHDKAVQTVVLMLSLHQQLAEAKSVAQRSMIQQQIDATDAEIDRHVYALYGLTDAEIAVVEGD